MMKDEMVTRAEMLGKLAAKDAEIGVLRARLADALATVRDYEGTLCDIHRGIDHPRGRSIETADFYMAVGWFVGKAEQVLDKHDLIAHEPSDEEAGENDL